MPISISAVQQPSCLLPGSHAGRLRGGLAAWAGFTLPSAIALVLFAYGASALRGPTGTGLLHGLKLVAVAIVEQAVWGMARTLCPDRQRASIAAGIAAIILFSPSSIRAASSAPTGRVSVAVSRRVGVLSLIALFLLLVGLPLLRSLTSSHGVALFEAFYRSGALVSGGDHVVLPLLRAAVVVPGWVSDDVLLAGYGASQGFTTLPPPSQEDRLPQAGGHKREQSSNTAGPPFRARLGSALSGSRPELLCVTSGQVRDPVFPFRSARMVRG